MRIWVRMAERDALTRIFKGRRGRGGRAQQGAALYRTPGLISQRVDSKALGPSRRKENSSHRHRRRILGSTASPLRVVPVKES